MQRILIAAMLACSALVLPAHAQRIVAAAQATDAVSRGLLAQYEAALIRERRLADEREQRVIADYQARLTSTRAQADARVVGAEEALAQARAEYAAYVSPIAARDREARQLVEGYQAQLARDISQASPEQLAALQLFADGDQQAGFTQYRAESARRDAARQHRVEMEAQAARAATAADSRQLANMGETMRLNGRMTTNEVIELYETASTQDPSVASPWLSLAHLYMDANRIELSRQAAERGLVANPSLQERGQLQVARADALSALGRLPDARVAFESARDAARQRADAAPGDAEAQQQLAITLYRLGDILSAQGDNARAREAGEESLAILRRLIAADPSNVSVQRDLVGSLRELSTVRALQGDAAAARTYINESLGVARALVAADATNAALLEDLHDTMLSAAVLQETSVAALALAQESLVIARRLAASDPSSAQAQQNIVATLNRTGDIQMARRDYTNARPSFEEALAIERRLAAGDGANATVKNGVAVLLGRIAGVQIAQGDVEGARASFEESAVIYRQMIAADPSDTGAQRGLSDNLEILGDLQREQGDLASARANYAESLTITRRIAEADPSNASAQRAMWVSMERMAMNAPGGGVTWTDIARVMEDLDARGLIAESDKWALDRAREFAAMERAAAQ